MTTVKIPCPVCENYRSWCKKTKVGVHIFRTAQEEVRKNLRNKPHYDYLKKHARVEKSLTIPKEIIQKHINLKSYPLSYV